MPLSAFVNDAEVNGEPLSTDDLNIAYNGDVVVGARYWYGEATDIPAMGADDGDVNYAGYSMPCLLYTSPSPRDRSVSRMPSSA